MRKVLLTLVTIWCVSYASFLVVSPDCFAGDNALVGISLGGPTVDGKPVSVYLPVSQRLKNVGGRDGAGLCVFTSIAHAARYQNVDGLKDFQQWMRAYPGGGYPQKVDSMIDKKLGSNKPRYLQYEGRDPSILKKALANGYMPSLTYNGRDPNYGANKTIAHMVNILHCDNKWVILDNNFIQDDRLVHLSESEGMSRWLGGGEGWAVILLDPGLPPSPKR